MATRKHYGPDSDYLRMNGDGMVFLCSPEGASHPIGHVCGPDDACPEGLKDEFSRCYRDFLSGLQATPGSGVLPWRKSALPASRIAV
jgi:hypothetical protein